MQTKIDEFEKKIDTAITRIKKRNYLGASNDPSNPMARLGNFFNRVVIHTLPQLFSLTEKQTKADIKRFNFMYPYVNYAILNYTGAGNCGPQTASAYIELLLLELTPEQRATVALGGYNTGDSHGTNAYLFIGDVIYDVLAGMTLTPKAYKKKAAGKTPMITPGIDASIPTSLIKALAEKYLLKFAKLYEETLKYARETGIDYVTLDTDDTEEFAIQAPGIFNYLYTKFTETLNDPYFIQHPEEAESVRNNIVKNYIYLIEELRQDFLVGEVIIPHPRRIKYCDDAIRDCLKTLIPDECFTDFILAISNRNINPSKALELLAQIPLTTAVPIAKIIQDEITKLTPAADPATSNATNANRFFEPAIAAPGAALQVATSAP